MSFATNHLGPFTLTEALVPHLPDGANVVFVVSAVEDPERKPPGWPASAAGATSLQRRARAVSESGGAKRPGFDAYATSKQATLAAAMAFARETPRLRFNAVEPGSIQPRVSAAMLAPSCAFWRNLIPLLVPLFKPFVKILSTPKRAGQVITNIMSDPSRRPASITTRPVVRCSAPRSCAIRSFKTVSSPRRARCCRRPRDEITTIGSAAHIVVLEGDTPPLRIWRTTIWHVFW